MPLPINYSNLTSDFPKFSVELSERKPDPKTVCSFCQKTPPEQNLVTGPGVNICNECVDLAVEIFAEKRAEYRKNAIADIERLIHASSPQTSPAEAAACSATIFEAGYRREGE